MYICWFNLQYKSTFLEVHKQPPVHEFVVICYLQYSSASCCMVTAWLAGDFSCTSYLKFSLHTIFKFTCRFTQGGPGYAKYDKRRIWMVKDRTSRVAECQNNYTEKTLKLALKVPNLLGLATFYKHGNIRKLSDILQL